MRNGPHSSKEAGIASGLCGMIARNYVTGEETRLQLLLRLRALEMGLKQPDQRYVSDLEHLQLLLENQRIIMLVLSQMLVPGDASIFRKISAQLTYTNDAIAKLSQSKG